MASACCLLHLLQAATPAAGGQAWTAEKRVIDWLVMRAVAFFALPFNVTKYAISKLLAPQIAMYEAMAAAKGVASFVLDTAALGAVFIAHQYARSSVLG